MINLDNICKEVQVIAQQAGEYIAEQRKSFSYDKVEFKGAHNLVSYVDKGAEKMIVARLKEVLPEAGFITEEGTVESGGGERYRWVIDPLDGTTNFVHGLPPYCVSIALMDGEQSIVGVVYEITQREMFYATAESEAYVNGEVIKASKIEKLDQALVAIGFSVSAMNMIDGFLDSVAWYQRNTDGIRRLGSAATDLVYVACGRIDAYCQVKLSAWDVAAGVLIAQRAGAVVTDFKGGDNFIFGGEMIATTPKIYDEFMKILLK